ncbi:MAG TPA: glycosyltransferase, partial [Gaiellaceae bacterium]|nr:glycosyltransferase [Gaiellaceae bacterium]
DSELVVTVGRYTEQKNHHVLLDALALLAPERPRLRALLVGVGELEEELVRRTTELDLEGVVTITGERNDAIDITAAADVFALSSDWEGLPLALLEAMALGTPVVATAVNGVPDAISDGDNGLLVPRRDPAALAQALARVLDDDELRRRLGSRARAWAAAQCSEAAMTSGYLGVYASVLERRRRSGASPS